jgi:two-component system, NarL family, nitrate/nitrite response regulator NarL
MNSASATIDILIVDDHQLVRDGLRLRLGAIEDFRVVGEAGCLSDAVRLTERLRPHLVLTDLSMKGGSGIVLARELHARHPAVHVLVLSMHNNAEYAAQARSAGAAGYVLKDSPAQEIVDAIRAIQRGGTHFSAELARLDGAGSVPAARSAVRYEQIEKLTPRENDILRELANGLSNKQIAALHDLSVRTVEAHRMSIRRKLEVEGQAELIKFAVEFFGRA